jgi:hypothetical protein
MRKDRKMTTLPLSYIFHELRTFKNAIREGDLDLADTCLSHLESTIISELKDELDQAFIEKGDKEG